MLHVKTFAKTRRGKRRGKGYLGKRHWGKIQLHAELCQFDMLSEEPVSGKYRMTRKYPLRGYCLSPPTEGAADDNVEK